MRHNSRKKASSDVVKTTFESAQRALQLALITSISYAWVCKENNCGQKILRVRVVVALIRLAVDPLTNTDRGTR